MNIMGNYSIYVYKTMNDYIKLYPVGQEDVSELTVEAMLVGSMKFAVISDQAKKAAGYKPELTKTLIYYNGGLKEFEKYAKDSDEELQHVTDVKYYMKDNTVEFEGEDYGIKLPCARFVGDKPEEGWFTHDIRIEGYIMFDELRNRMNLIVFNDDSS